MDEMHEHHGQPHSYVKRVEDDKALFRFAFVLGFILGGGFVGFWWFLHG